MYMYVATIPLRNLMQSVTCISSVTRGIKCCFYHTVALGVLGARSYHYFCIDGNVLR
jgi:hypothetical protein